MVAKECENGRSVGMPRICNEEFYIMVNLLILIPLDYLYYKNKRLLGNRRALEDSERRKERAENEQNQRQNLSRGKVQTFQI